MFDGARLLEVVFEGCRLGYVRLGRAGTTPLLMLHGGGAHRGWWSRVAPLLADRFEMILPDLSGHGDSEHRTVYGPGLWARELVAILDHEGEGTVRVVGHSMGGLIGIFMAVDHPELVQSLVIVDSGLRPPDGKAGSTPRGRERRPVPVYETEDLALERFRLRPDGTTASPELLQQIGRQGLRRLADGWTWKFDPHASQRFTDQQLHEVLPKVVCPVGIIYGEESEVASAATVDYVETRLGRWVPSLEVAQAHHHIPLDQPEACAAAIAQMLAFVESEGSDDVGEAAIQIDRGARQIGRG